MKYKCVKPFGVFKKNQIIDTSNNPEYEKIIMENIQNFKVLRLL